MANTLTPFNNSSPSRLLFLQALLTLITLFFSFSSAIAETWYVKPSTKIPVHRGQGSDYKITTFLQNGTKVDIVEEMAPWVKIITQKGKEGWMLKKYLEQKVPLPIVIEKLRQENDSLREKNSSLTSKNNELASQNTYSQSELSSRTAELDQTREQYQALTADTADVMLIKNNLDKSEGTIKTLKRELSVMSTKNQELKSNQNIKWFLAGGGTLILGCLVGMTSSKSRRKKSSFY